MLIVNTVFEFSQHLIQAVCYCIFDSITADILLNDKITFEVKHVTWFTVDKCKNNRAGVEGSLQVEMITPF